VKIRIFRALDWPRHYAAAAVIFQSVHSLYSITDDRTIPQTK